MHAGLSSGSRNHILANCELKVVHVATLGGFFQLARTILLDFFHNLLGHCVSRLICRGSQVFLERRHGAYSA